MVVLIVVLAAPEPKCVEFLNYMQELLDIYHIILVSHVNQQEGFHSTPAWC